VDGVYICAHGAAVTTAEDDPEGVLFERVRRIVGPEVPVVATFDLHANVSDRMVETIDAFIGYRTNPHLDMRERGAEAAAVLRDLLAGMKTKLVRVRLPIVPPTVTMLTAAGPYAEMIALGQRRRKEIGPAIVNVSAMGGFAYSDTAKNGLTVVVTARRGERGTAAALAEEIARYGWDNRARFYPTLTSIEEAVAKAVAAAGAATRCTCFGLSPKRASRGRCSGSSTILTSPPRRIVTGGTTISTRGSTAPRRRISPSLGARQRGLRRCLTATASDGAASMPGCVWHWGRAPRSQSVESRWSSCRTVCNAPTPCFST
jgi:microcystin degradation protein MlrC